MTRVFLSIPVQGKRLPSGVYDAMIRGARAGGLRVVNAEVNEPPTLAELARLSPHVVYSHNRALLETASFMVAEVSQPSLGVGYEIAIAEMLGIPILALADSSLLPQASLMIRGLSYRHFHLVSYAHPDEISGIIQAFVGQGSPIAASVRAEVDDAAVVSHFDHLAEVYDESTEWRRNEEVLHWLSSRLEGRARCLDLGAGTGLVGAQIRRHGTKVVGLDRSGEMLRLAASRLDWAVRGDATSLPFAAMQFDGVAVRSVLHYLDDLECIREVKRILRADGVLVCAQATAPDTGAAAWWEFLKRRTQPLRRRFYTTATLLQRFKSGGFYIVESTIIRIERRETWEGVLRYCPPTESDGIRAMIREAPAAVVNANRLRIDAEGMTYEQHWTLLLAAPVSSA